MQVDRATTNGTAPRQGHLGATILGHQWAQNENRGPHGFDQVIGRRKAFDGGRIDLHIQLFIHSEPDAHASEEFQCRGDIQKVRHIADADGCIG